jgi:hypothetical protein
MVRSLAVLLVLSACGKNRPDDDTDNTGIEPLPPTFIGYTERVSDAERRGTSLQVALMRVTFGDDDTWNIGDQLAISPLTGTGNFGVILPDEPPSNHIRPIEGGRSGSFYLPIVFDDVNRNGQFNDGAEDLVLGFAETQWLVWLDEPASGEPAGWSVVDRSQGSVAFLPLNVQAVVNLWGLSSEPRITGVLTLRDDPVGIIARDARFYDPGEPSDFLGWSVVSNPSNGRFDTRVTIRPSIGAFQFPDDGVRYVRMAHNLFLDLDGNGTYTNGIDELLDDVGLCYDGQRFDVRFIDTPRTIAVARILSRDRMTSGWRFVVGDTEVNTTQTANIPFGLGCPL